MSTATFNIQIYQNLSDSEFNETKMFLTSFFNDQGFELQSIKRKQGSTIIELVLYCTGAAAGAGIFALKVIAGEEIKLAYKKMKEKYLIKDETSSIDIEEQVLRNPPLAADVSKFLSDNNHNEHFILPPNMAEHFKGYNLEKISISGKTPEGLDFEFTQEVNTDKNIINYNFSFSRPLNTL